MSHMSCVPAGSATGAYEEGLYLAAVPRPGAPAARHLAIRSPQSRTLWHHLFKEEGSMRRKGGNSIAPRPGRCLASIERQWLCLYSLQDNGSQPPEEHMIRLTCPLPPTKSSPALPALTRWEEQLLAQCAQRHEGLLRQEEKLVCSRRGYAPRSARPQTCRASSVQRLHKMPKQTMPVADADTCARVRRLAKAQCNKCSSHQAFTGQGCQHPCTGCKKLC